jgi:hypothetical protein
MLQKSGYSLHKALYNLTFDTPEQNIGLRHEINEPCVLFVTSRVVYIIKDQTSDVSVLGNGHRITITSLTWADNMKDVTLIASTDAALATRIQNASNESVRSEL